MKMSFIALCFMALTACGQVSAQDALEARSEVVDVRTTEIQPTDTVTPEPVLAYGADVNRGECASGFVRKAPGICNKLTFTNILTANLVSAQVCSLVDLTALVPPNTKTISVSYVITLRTANSVGNHSARLRFYNTNSGICTAGSYSRLVQESAREWVATTVSDMADIADVVDFIPITDRKFDVDYGANAGLGAHNFSINLIGYTD